MWYTNLVQLRLHTVERTGSCEAWDAIGLYNADGTEDVQFLAIAREILSPLRLDDYSYAAQAYILGLSVLEVREYLRETLNEVGLQESAATLIIEDEAAVALDIARIVRQTGHQVCGTATRLDQALSMAARMQPEIVLADVQLRDGPEAGLAAVREIGRTGAAAVYVTAYPERVRDAESTPIIVSKPFVANEIKGAIWRALYRRRQGTAVPA
jgi:CheY-like chemotaxis protein